MWNEKYKTVYGIFLVLSALIIGMLLTFGPSFGVVFAAGVLIYIGLWIYIHRIAKLNPQIVYIRYLKNLMLGAFIAWFISFAVLEGLVIANSISDIASDCDYVLILGAGLRGEKPSIVLKSRLEKSLEFLNQNESVKIVVSGGMGEGENITEAEAMKRYLIDNGTDEYRIIKEEKSTSTKENLIFSKSILDELESEDYRVLIITSNFHAFRTRILAGQEELKAYVLTADTPLVIYVNYAIREYFGFIKMLIE